MAFLSDRDGEFDLWVSQVGTGIFHNLTRDFPPLAPADSSCGSSGFSADSSEIWFNPGDGKPPMLMPWTGGTPGRSSAQAPTRPPGLRTAPIVYVDKANRDDPIYLADRTGADARQILGPGTLKNMNPVWSPDSQWIYFARGSEPQDETEMDVWRLRPSGGSPERVTTQHLAINFLAPLDLTTAALRGACGGPVGALALVARCRERSVDPRAVGRRSIHVGVGQSRRPAHRRHRRQSQREPVACAAARSAWRRTATPSLTSCRSRRAWRSRRASAGSRCSICLRAGPATASGRSRTERRRRSRRGVDGALSEPPAVSPDGRRLAVVVRREGKRHLSIMSADGTNATDAGAVHRNRRSGGPGRR